MKSSQILVSALFGAFAAAVPFKRDLVTKTEVMTETVVVYTTVWDDEVPTAQATTAGGYFYEQPASSAAETTPAAISTPAYTPSSTPAYTPSPVQESSVYTPPVQTSAAPAPSSTVVVVSSAAPAPETSSAAPAAPTSTEAAYTPSAVVSSAAPAATSVAASTASTSTGETFTGDLTINPLTGALGACGTNLYPTDMVVALAASAWGASTYDTMTGAATNPWCGKKINIEYNGKSVPATIMDLCPGCSGHDIDLSDAAWAAIGMTEWTRVKGSWSLAE